MLGAWTAEDSSVVWDNHVPTSFISWREKPFQLQKCKKIKLKGWGTHSWAKTQRILAFRQHSQAKNMKKARSGAKTTRTGKGNSPDNVTPWGKHAKSCVSGKGEGREMNPYFPVHFVHWGRHFPPQIAFSLRFPYHKKMHPGGGQNIIKGKGEQVPLV